MKIIRKELTPLEISPYGTFWDPSCSCVKSVPPGGGTPFENPAADPRTNPANLIPLRATGDIPCDSAANVVYKLKASVNELVQSLDQFQIATSTLALFLAFFPGVGDVADFFIALGEIAIAIGASTIEGAFTDDQWELVLCIVYCHMASDGSISAAAVASILSDITAQCNETVNSILSHEINGLGWVGMTDAGASGAVTGDCTACACVWCYEWLSIAEIHVDWVTVDDVAGSQFYNADFGTTITDMSMGWTKNGVGTGSGSGIGIWNGAAFTNNKVLILPIGASTSPTSVTFAAEASLGGVSFGLNAAARSGGVVAITSFQLKGTGAHPAWTGGHEC